jgi:hypothetical protein
MFIQWTNALIGEIFDGKFHILQHLSFILVGMLFVPLYTTTWRVTNLVSSCIVSRYDDIVGVGLGSCQRKDLRSVHNIQPQRCRRVYVGDVYCYSCNLFASLFDA